MTCQLSKKDYRKYLAKHHKIFKIDNRMIEEDWIYDILRSGNTHFYSFEMNELPIRCTIEKMEQQYVMTID